MAGNQHASHPSVGLDSDQSCGVSPDGTGTGSCKAPCAHTTIQKENSSCVAGWFGGWVGWLPKPCNPTFEGNGTNHQWQCAVLLPECWTATQVAGCWVQQHQQRCLMLLDTQVRTAALCYQPLGMVVCGTGKQGTAQPALWHETQGSSVLQRAKTRGKPTRKGAAPESRRLGTPKPPQCPTTPLCDILHAQRCQERYTPVTAMRERQQLSPPSRAGVPERLQEQR